MVKNSSSDMFLKSRKFTARIYEMKNSMTIKKLRNLKIPKKPKSCSKNIIDEAY